MKKVLMILLCPLMVLFAENYVFLNPSDDFPKTVGQIITIFYIVAFGYFAFFSLSVFKNQQKKELTYKRRIIALFFGFIFSNLVAVAFTVLFLGEDNNIFLVSRVLLSEDGVLVALVALSALVLVYPNQIVQFCTKKHTV